MKLQSSYIADFIALLFPELCQACGESLVGDEKLICTGCLFELPYTNFHLQPDNIVARIFWGRINLQAAYALLYFTKGGRVQQMMHAFKYKNQPDIGRKLGQMAAEQLLLSPVLANVDYIIPVPLHPSKLRKRGYNQSQSFADGLAEKLNAVALTDNLIRTRATETQTHKSRFSRFENMREVFVVNDPKILNDKHVLLVDDIVTTGATLEACGEVLLQIPGLRLSIAAIAYAE